MNAGIVYLVGAGPGDPGLVTLRARELLEQAEVVVYDYLCNPALLNWVPLETEIIYAGKAASSHTLTQDQINQLLVDKAKAGRCVVRLKGGDPFVFGRGAEEAEVLLEAGIPFEIVPGISSAIAAPAYAGIPVTHRSCASSFAVFTGHEDAAKNETMHDWKNLAQFSGTRVILMGVERLRTIAERLIEEGAAADLPIALVRWGTRPNQETLEGTLGTIADLAEAHDFKAPAVAILGPVVALRERLAWFEKRPLFGRRVVVTRTRAQASHLSTLLRDQGADVLEIPTIRIERIANPLPDHAANWGLPGSRFEWLLFTSPNGVDAFFDHFLEIHGDLRALGSVQIAVVGPATAARVRMRGLAIARQPSAFTAEALAEAFQPAEIQDHRFCLARGDLAEAELPQRLTALGGQVTEWTLYRTLPETEDRTGTRRRFEAEGADWIVFASSSAAENWHRLHLKYPGSMPKVASLGPITTRRLRELGYDVTVEAPESTLTSLVTKMISYENERSLV